MYIHRGILQLFISLLFFSQGRSSTDTEIIFTYTFHVPLASFFHQVYDTLRSFPLVDPP